MSAGADFEAWGCSMRVVVSEERALAEAVRLVRELLTRVDDRVSPCRLDTVLARAEATGRLSHPDELTRGLLAVAASAAGGTREEKVQAVIDRGMTQLGVRYSWGGGIATGPTVGVRDGGVADSYGDFRSVGFDCSGLAWWALGGAGGRLHEVAPSFRRRTADAMAWERPRERAPVAQLAPGDLVFFGDRGPRSRRGTISHMGVVLGNGWMAQASGSRAGATARCGSFCQR